MPRRSEITFELRVQDYLATREHLLGSGFRRERALAASLGLSLVLLVIVLGLLWHEPAPYLFGVLGGVVAVGISLCVLLGRVCRLCSPSREAFCRYDVRISEEGLHVVTPRFRTIHAWSAIRELGETPTHLFFVHDASTAQVVPKTAFDQLATLQRFLDDARASLARARTV